DGRPEDHSARRARRGREPGPAGHDRGPHRGTEPARHDLPHHRAQYGFRDVALQRGRGDGDGQGDRPRHARRGDFRPAGDRSLSRRCGRMSAPLLQVENVVGGYRPDLPIIHGISLTVGEKEMVTIIGPNGAGKSTLIKAIAGIVQVSSGRVLLAGRDITRFPTHKLAGASIAYVPQTNNVFTTLTINENLAVGASSLPKPDAARQIERAYEALPAPKDYRHKKARVLSGGQRQMLAVARALLTEPQLVMLDEPSAGLSPLMVSEVFQRLKQ